MLCADASRFELRPKISKAFGLTDALDLEPRYNIAPTQQVAAITLDPETGTRQLSMLRWALIPSWADDPKIGYGQGKLLAMLKHSDGFHCPNHLRRSSQALSLKYVEVQRLLALRR